eukprot:gene2803-1788_t
MLRFGFAVVLLYGTDVKRLAACILRDDIPDLDELGVVVVRRIATGLWKFCVGFEMTGLGFVVTGGFVTPILSFYLFVFGLTISLKRYDLFFKGCRWLLLFVVVDGDVSVLFPVMSSYLVYLVVGTFTALVYYCFDNWRWRLRLSWYLGSRRDGGAHYCYIVTYECLQIMTRTGIVDFGFEKGLYGIEAVIIFSLRHVGTGYAYYCGLGLHVKLLVKAQMRCVSEILYVSECYYLLVFTIRNVGWFDVSVVLGLYLLEQLMMCGMLVSICACRNSLLDTSLTVLAYICLWYGCGVEGASVQLFLVYVYKLELCVSLLLFVLQIGGCELGLFVVLVWDRFLWRLLVFGLMFAFMVVYCKWMFNVVDGAYVFSLYVYIICNDVIVQFIKYEFAVIYLAYMFTYGFEVCCSIASALLCFNAVANTWLGLDMYRLYFNMSGTGGYFNLLYWWVVCLGVQYFIDFGFVVDDDLPLQVLLNGGMLSELDACGLVTVLVAHYSTFIGRRDNVYLFARQVFADVLAYLLRNLNILHITCCFCLWVQLLKLVDESYVMVAINGSWRVGRVCMLCDSGFVLLVTCNDYSYIAFALDIVVDLCFIVTKRNCKRAGSGSGGDATDLCCFGLWGLMLLLILLYFDCVLKFIIHRSAERMQLFDAFMLCCMVHDRLLFRFYMYFVLSNWACYGFATCRLYLSLLGLLVLEFACTLFVFGDAPDVVRYDFSLVISACFLWVGLRGGVMSFEFHYLVRGFRLDWYLLRLFACR